MKVDVSEDYASALIDGLATYAYVVHCGEPEEASVLVYASSEAMAREIGCRNLSGNPVECEAERDEKHDARAAMFLVGRIEDDAEYLRTAGWRMEGESYCCCCSLAAFGMEKYGICCISNNCKECGCDDDDELGPCKHEPETYALDVTEKWTHAYMWSRVTEWTTIDSGGMVHRVGQIQPSSMGVDTIRRVPVYVHLCNRLTRATGTVEEHTRELRPQITCLHCILIPEGPTC